MPDLSLEWNDDFVVSPSGGLSLASDNDFARQRIERRLLTAVRGYIWALDYGAGLPQKIGSPAQQSEIQALVASQVALESSVAPSPPPVVKVYEDAQDASLYYISITYTAAANGEPVTMTFAPK